MSRQEPMSRTVFLPHWVFYPSTGEDRAIFGTKSRVQKKQQQQRAKFRAQKKNKGARSYNQIPLA